MCDFEVQLYFALLAPNLRSAAHLRLSPMVILLTSEWQRKIYFDLASAYVLLARASTCGQSGILGPHVTPRGCRVLHMPSWGTITSSFKFSIHHTMTQPLWPWSAHCRIGADRIQSQLRRGDHDLKSIEGWPRLWTRRLVYEPRMTAWLQLDDCGLIFKCWVTILSDCFPSA